LSNERDRRLGIVARTLFGTGAVQEREAAQKQPQVPAEPTTEKTEAQIWHDVLSTAKEEPRISFVSPKVKAVLMFLRKTTPEFNISKVTAAMVEEAVSKRWLIFGDAQQPVDRM
jgi:hypothetical protein